MIRHLSKRERWVLMVTMTVVVISGGDRLILQPFTRAVQGQVKSVRSKEERLARDLAFLGEADKVRRVHDLVSAQFGSHLTAEEESSSLLKEVEQIGQLSSVVILDLKPIAPRDESRVRVYGLELEFEGSIEDIARFLMHVAESPEGLRVDKMRLAARRGSGSVLRAHVQVSKARLLP